MRRTALLWCDRHCCLCKRPCGVDIEVDHLIPEAEGGTDTIANALPLCFDCHGKVHRYNERHPRGTKYFREELRTRRDQVYEEFTRPLVPPVICQITQALGGGKSRQLPDVGFLLQHHGDGLPVKVRVSLKINGLSLGSPYYNGERLWRLNPRHAISGHFSTPRRRYRGRLSIIVDHSIIDSLGYEHPRLPAEYAYKSNGNTWYLEP